jgi:Sulfotransferase family
MESTIKHLLETVSPETRDICNLFIDISIVRQNYARNVIANTSLYLNSLLGGLANTKNFQKIEKYCMFLGCSRSGHTLVSALMDSHPNMIISNEMDTLKLFANGFSKQQVYYLILEHSKADAKIDRNIGGYSYKILNQEQASFNQLKVIGDKHAPVTTTRLYMEPKLLENLYNKVGVPIKFIHVIRNPYDNIKTMATKDFGGLKLEVAMELYFLLCQGVTSIQERIDPSNILNVRHESLIQNPQKVLEEISDFLGLDTPTNGYIEDCSKIIYKTPHKSRHETAWDEQLIKKIRENIDKYDFLKNSEYSE